MATESALHSDLAVPPGEYLEEVLHYLGMSKEELATRMDRPPSKFSAIFRGGKAITPDTALQLEKVVGVPAHIWTGLESEYRLTLARQAERDEEAQIRTEVGMVKEFCYNELAQLGLVRPTREQLERARELRAFLGVTSLRSVKEVGRYGLAFRKSRSVKHSPSPEALVSWLRIGEKRAHEVDCPPFDRGMLLKGLPEIRTMTLRRPKDFQHTLTRLLARCGVAFILCPHLPRTYVHGATFWLKDKAVVMMTIRGAWADIFWFSLFHELGHVLKHGKHETFLEFDNGDPARSQQEVEADQFAQDTLLPPEEYGAFLEACGDHVYADATRRFAKKVGIHPGIVVGRLQHDGRIDRGWQNDLRIRLKWEE